MADRLLATNMPDIELGQFLKRIHSPLAMKVVEQDDAYAIDPPRDIPKIALGAAFPRRKNKEGFAADRLVGDDVNVLPVAERRRRRRRSAPISKCYHIFRRGEFFQALPQRVGKPPREGWRQAAFHIEDQASVFASSRDVDGAVAR